MKEEIEITDNESPPAVSRRRGKRRKLEPVRFSSRIPKWRNVYNVNNKWTLNEKFQLLEGLKRYDNDNISSIAKLIETKTEEEVEAKIQAIIGSDVTRNADQLKTAPGKDSEDAPIETWIDLIQEMVNFEAVDYSQFVPKVLGLITRNEEFADSGYPQLKWKNIYQFLIDITSDRLEVQKLTNLESLVVLDVMHSLGDNLLKSDTAEHRQILDFKYNLLNFKKSSSEEHWREANIQRIAQALGNDFYDSEDICGCLSGTRSVPGSASQQPPAQTTANKIETVSGTMPKTTREQTATAPEARPEPSTGEAPTISVTWHQPTAGVLDNPVAGTSSESVSQDSHPEQPSSSSQADADLSSYIARTQILEKRFVHPKFFSLNPLCIRSQQLTFRPK